MKFLYAAATLSLATTVVFSGNGPESDETEKCDYLCQLEQNLGDSEMVKQIGEMLNSEKLGEQLKELFTPTEEELVQYKGMQQQWEEEMEQMKQIQEACTNDEGKVDHDCVLEKELARAGVTDEEEISEIKQMQQQMQEEMKKMKQISDEIVKECTNDEGEVDPDCVLNKAMNVALKHLKSLNVEDASDRITVIDDEEITEGQTGRLLDQDSQ